ncbi:MAG: ATP-binding protein [Candidatus Methylomirabilia bacterium]
MGSSIGIRLFVGFLAIIFVTGLIVLVAIGRLSELRSIATELMQKEIPEVHVLWKIRSLLSEMETDVRHLLLKHERENHLLHVWEQDTRVRESLETFRSLHPLLPEKEEQLVVELASRYRSFRKATANVITLVQRGEETKARALFLGTWEEHHQATLESLVRLLAYEDQEMERRVALAQAKSRSSHRMIIALGAVGLFLSLALALGITFSLTRPITKLVEATERVTGGDLASKAEIIRQDEIGLLARGFNEMLDRLNRSFEDQRRFYADASHELRTPLTIIRGEAEVALREPEKSVKAYREALETVNAVASQMGRLVDELLFLARSEAGQIRYEMAEVALAPLLEEVARQSEGLSALKGVHLETDVSRRMAVRGDPQRLRQLFLVLVDNAIKYTAPGGKVTLALKAEPDRARVLVSDTGIGIPERDLPHIFERFYRVDGAGARPEEGTGLGLAIARSIVRAHQGEIFVDSALGRGTTVSVLLPHVSSRG